MQVMDKRLYRLSNIVQSAANSCDDAATPGASLVCVGNSCIAAKGENFASTMHSARPPAPATPIVVRKPNNCAIQPPAKEPSGAQAIERKIIVDVTRPSR